MKTAISIADDVFHRAEHYARWQKKSRSELYAEAIAEYLARHDADAVTEAMNKTLDEVGQSIDPFIREAGRRTLKRNEW
jgi:predicted transcriptional regulator